MTEEKLEDMSPREAVGSIGIGPNKAYFTFQDVIQAFKLGKSVTRSEQYVSDEQPATYMLSDTEALAPEIDTDELRNSPQVGSNGHYFVPGPVVENESGELRSTAIDLGRSL